MPTILQWQMCCRKRWPLFFCIYIHIREAYPESSSLLSHEHTDQQSLSLNYIAGTKHRTAFQAATRLPTLLYLPVIPRVTFILSLGWELLAGTGLTKQRQPSPRLQIGFDVKEKHSRLLEVNRSRFYHFSEQAILLVFTLNSLTVSLSS